MIEWLKGTVPGIILLGVVSSLLTIWLVKLALFLTQRIFRPAVSSTIGRLIALSKKPDYIIEDLKSSTDVRQLIVACSLNLLNAVNAAASLVLSLIILMLGATASPVPGLVGSGTRFLLTFVGSFLCLLSFAWVRLSARIMVSIYQIHMADAEAKATARAQVEYLKKWGGPQAKALLATITPATASTGAKTSDSDGGKSWSFKFLSGSVQPTTVARGDTLELHYVIEASDEVADALWLGASFKDQSGTYFYNTSQDALISLAKGVHPYHRKFTIQPSFPTGEQHLALSLWRGVVGDSRKSKCVGKVPAIAILING